MKEKIKKDLAIMKILKTSELRYHIGRTARGASIDLQITKEDPKYTFFIDASPLETEENEAMVKIYGLN